MPNSIYRTLTILSAAALFQMPSTASAMEVTPPQGYIALDHTINPGAPSELSDLEYNFTFNSFDVSQAGTFWANTFAMANSENNALFPDNYVGGQQGGYIGLQKRPDGTDIAIFSIFWGLDTRAAPGVTAVNDIEMWYLDDNPFDPPIRDLSDVDTSRVTAGGPFSSLRIDVDLVAGDDYAFSLQQSADPQGDLWSASLINKTQNTSQDFGGNIVPEAWGGLNAANIGGFVEHFGPMPEGCDSIPASNATFKSATTSAGDATTLSPRVYGLCQENIEARAQLSCTGSECNVVVNDTGVTPVPLPAGLPALALGLAGLMLAGRRKT